MDDWVNSGRTKRTTLLPLTVILDTLIEHKVDIAWGKLY